MPIGACSKTARNRAAGSPRSICCRRAFQTDVDGAVRRILAWAVSGTERNGRTRVRGGNPTQVVDSMQERDEVRYGEQTVQRGPGGETHQVAGDGSEALTTQQGVP